MKISASVYAAKTTPLPRLAQELEALGVDYLHVDCNAEPAVFDDIRVLKQHCDLPVDLHIIADSIAPYWQRATHTGVDYLTVQYEHLPAGFQLPQTDAFKVGIGITGGTPVEALLPYREQFDFVLLMTTTPGQSGGRFDKRTFARLRAFNRLFPEKQIHVDGGITDEVSFILRMSGVACAVSGSYLLGAPSLGIALRDLKGHPSSDSFKLAEFMIPREELEVLTLGEFDFKGLLRNIDRVGLGVALVEHPDGRFAGILSNADVRRGLLQATGHLDALDPRILAQRQPHRAATRGRYPTLARPHSANCIPLAIFARCQRRAAALRARSFPHPQQRRIVIIHLPTTLSDTDAQAFAERNKAFWFRENDHIVAVNGSKLKYDNLSHDDQQLAIAHWDFPNDMQLSNAGYRPLRRIELFNGVVFGGDKRRNVLMTGPCSVESETQIRQVAELCVETGVKVLRAGAYKPRTAPYSFQGMGLAGLKLLAKMREEYGLAIITEVRDASQVDEVIDYADIVQVGAKAMYDQGILRACAKTDRPIMIKRGFGSTLQETAQAAEFVLSGGNPNVMLCERGLRTFEPYTRFTLDIVGAAWMKHETNLPVILDPSHPCGRRDLVPDVARACAALNVDGLLIETHPTPDQAKSDPAQQLDFEMFRALAATLQPLRP